MDRRTDTHTDTWPYTALAYHRAVKISPASRGFAKNGDRGTYKAHMQYVYTTKRYIMQLRRTFMYFVHLSHVLLRVQCQ